MSDYAYYMFIGLNNDYTNSFAQYFQEFGRTYNEALINAHVSAANTASEALTKSALKVMQVESKSLNASLEFRHLSDKINQSRAIKTLLKNMGCRILKAGFAPDGSYRVRVVNSDYNLSTEFADAVVDKAYEA